MSRNLSVLWILSRNVFRRRLFFYKRPNHVYNNVKLCENLHESKLVYVWYPIIGHTETLVRVNLVLSSNNPKTSNIDRNPYVLFN